MAQSRPPLPDPIVESAESVKVRNDYSSLGEAIRHVFREAGYASEYDDAAAVGSESRRAICRDCDRSWDGAGVEEVGEAHAARYDHRVNVVHRVEFDGPAEGSDDE